jgi:ankyrin repeat protein
LPPTLQGTYERILERVLQRPQLTQELVANSLRWISYATNPLPITELCAAVSIRQGDQNCRTSVSEIQIFNHCSSLIRKSNDGKYIELAHFTVREFLDSIKISSDPRISRFCMANARLQLGITSLTYLNFKEFCDHLPTGQAEYSNFLARYPFYSHASTEWPEYLCDYWDNAAVTELCRQLFEPQKSSNFLSWCLAYLYQVSQDIDETEDSSAWAASALQQVGSFGYTTLHWAALLGIPSLVEWLISRKVEADQVGFCGTAFHAAILGDLVFDLRVSNAHYNTILNLIPDFWTSNRKRCIEHLLANEADWKISFTVLGDVIPTGELLLYTRDSTILSLEPYQKSFLNETGLQRLKLNLSKSFKTLLPKEKEFYLNLPDCLVDENCRDDFNGFIAGLRVSIESGSRILAATSATQLLLAASNGQADVLRMLLRLPSIDIDAKGLSTGQTALHESLNSGSSECVTMLLENGASIHLKDAKGHNALHHCAKNLDTSFAVKFMSLGLSFHEADLRGRTLSHLAAESNNIELLRLLASTEGGAALTVHHKDEHGYSPLHFAASKGSDEALIFLLPYGNINERTKYGESLIHLAALRCSRGTIEFLIEKDIDVLARTDSGNTVLHYLVQNPRETTDLFELFFKRGLQFDASNSNGDTLLHMAFQSPTSFTQARYDLITRFIKLCNLKALNKNGDTALHSLFRSNISLAKKKSLTVTLILAGADPEIEDAVGNSYVQLLIRDVRLEASGTLMRESALALLQSVLSCPNTVSALEKAENGFRPLNTLISISSPLATSLVERGIDFTLCDECNPPISGVEMACYYNNLLLLDIMIARSKNFTKTFPPPHLLLSEACSSKETVHSLVQRILSLGCDVNAPGRESELPLISAIQNNNTDVAKLLLNYGASPEKKGGVDKWNAIHWAVQRGNIDLLSAIFKLNVDWNIRIFSSAIQSKTTNIVVRLRNAHAIHLASNQDSNALAFLLQHDLADCNLRDQFGATALHLAAGAGELNCCEILIAAGADVEAKDDFGETILHYIARGSGSIDIASKILSLGGEQIANAFSSTPEDIALHAGKVELAKLFRETRIQNGTFLFTPLPLPIGS